MVRYHNSGTQKFDDTEHESVKSPEANLGNRYSSVGDSAPKFATTEDIEIWVDADNGDDSDSGTQTKPIETLAEASSRIPKHIYHNVRVFIKDSAASPGTPGFVNHYISPDSDVAGLKIIGHHPDNPLYSGVDASQITIAYGLSAGNRGAEEFEVKGITIDGRWQCYDGIVRFEDCKFKSGAGTNNVCIDGYLNRVRCFNCDFADAGEVTIATQGSHVTLINCTASNLTRPYRAQNGGIVSLRDSDQIVDNASNDPVVDESSLQIGGPNGLLMDDDNGALGVGGEIYSNPSAGSGTLSSYGQFGQLLFRQDDGTPGAGVTYNSSDNRISFENKVNGTVIGLIRQFDGFTVTFGGPADRGQVNLENTRIYEDENGEVVVEDANGNTTTIS